MLISYALICGKDNKEFPLSLLFYILRIKLLFFEHNSIYYIWVKYFIWFSIARAGIVVTNLIM